MANGDTDQLVCPTHLNALSLTCKTLRDTSLPKHYRRVDVKVPAGHFQLNALDYLLLSSGEGLNFTRKLRILPQQGPLHPPFDERNNLDEDGKVRRIFDYDPGNRASTLFNLLIRQLIMKITLDYLQLFE